MRLAKGIFSAKPKVWLVLIIIAYFISRFALLKTGFGLDPDAWRIANSAYILKKVEFLTEGEMIYFERKFPNKKFWDHEKDVWFAYLLTDDDLNYFKGAKYEIFFLPGLDEANRKIYGVDLRLEGAREMPIH